MPKFVWNFTDKFGNIMYLSLSFLRYSVVCKPLSTFSGVREKSIFKLVSSHLQYPGPHCFNRKTAGYAANRIMVKITFLNNYHVVVGKSQPVSCNKVLFICCNVQTCDIDFYEA